MVDFLAGVLQIANVFLAIVAGIIGLTLFKAAFTRKELKAWKILILVLVLFAIVEVFGAFNAFGIYVTYHMTHLIASLITGLIIYTLVIQLEITK